MPEAVVKGNPGQFTPGQNGSFALPEDWRMWSHWGLSRDAVIGFALVEALKAMKLRTRESLS